MQYQSLGCEVSLIVPAPLLNLIELLTKRFLAELKQGQQTLLRVWALGLSRMSQVVLPNTHPTLGEGQNGKLYGSGPDPFPPPAQ